MDELRAAIADPDRRRRSGAVRELRRHGGDEAAEILAVALDDGSRLVRMQAVEALGVVGGAAATRILLARMDDAAASTMMRRSAFDAFATIGTPEVADLLEQRLDTFDSRRGRRVVEKRIAKIRARHGA
jgi:HEAT repeat protein